VQKQQYKTQSYQVPQVRYKQKAYGSSGKLTFLTWWEPCQNHAGPEDKRFAILSVVSIKVEHMYIP
jgi:hypothetical protein